MSDWAHKYVGVPFKEKGRSMDGFDCWGLVQWSFAAEREIFLPGYLECYEDTQDRTVLGTLIEQQKTTVWEPVTGKHQGFDIIICNMRGVPMHVGIVTRPGFMLHCARGVNTVIERYDTSKWRNSIEGVVRYVGEGTGRLRSPAALQQ